MLKTKKLLTATLAAIIGLSFVACVPPANPTPNGGTEEQQQEEQTESTAIDYTSYPAANALITVKNNSSSDMVLFNGVPSNEKILGGVRANSKITLKRDPVLFPKATDFIVYVVTADNYEANKDNLKVLDTAPYTSFMAVYNDNASNTDFFYQISSALRGTNKLIINNPTNYNLELRNMGMEGETLCFVRKGTYQVTYNLDRAAVTNEGQVMLFPVFRKFDSNSGEIFDIYPTYTSGRNAGKPKFVLFGFDDENSKFEMNASEWVEGIKFCPSATYIEIINNADMGLKFYDGKNATARTTSSGGVVINTGKSMIFPVNMTQLSGTSYSETVTLAGYRLGNNDINDIYIFSDLVPDAEGKVTYEATTANSGKTQELKGGCIYSFTISGGMEDNYYITPKTETIEETTTEIETAAYTDEDGVEHPAVYKKAKKTVLKAVPYEF